jgi:hypothetical protein
VCIGFLNNYLDAFITPATANFSADGAPISVLFFGLHIIFFTALKPFFRTPSGLAIVAFNRGSYLSKTLSYRSETFFGIVVSLLVATGR